MALIIKLRIDHSTRAFELFSASEMDSLLDRLFCGKVNNQSVNCEKVKVPVTHSTIQNTPIKYGVHPRKIGVRDLPLRCNDGDLAGLGDALPASPGLGGRSKGLDTTIDLGH